MRKVEQAIQPPCSLTTSKGERERRKDSLAEAPLVQYSEKTSKVLENPQEALK